MRFLANLSIKRKQVLIILLTSAVTLLLACTAFVVYDVTTFRREMVEQAVSVADVISRNCTAAVDFNDSRSAEETLAALEGEPSILAARVFKRDGTPFADYSRNKTQVSVPAPTHFRPEHKFTREHLVLSRPVVHQDEAIAIIVLMYDLSELSQRFTRYLAIVGVVFLVSLLVAFVLSARLQRVVSGPIQSLARVARAVAIEKDYSLRVKKESGDELGQLMDGFNEMLTQIQERDAKLQAARNTLEERVRERTEQLASSVSLLNATLESTADGILVMDQLGHVTKFNAKFLEMWGIARPSSAGKEDAALLEALRAHLKNGDAFLAQLREPNADQNSQKSDSLELADGRVFDCHSQAQRVDGAYVGRVWSFRDVTERRRAEQALRERLAMQERLAKIAATVPGVIHTFRVAADGTSSMPYASPRLEEIYGLRPEEVAHDASRIFERMHPEDRERVRASVAEACRMVTRWRQEFRVQHPRLGEIWVEGNSMPEREDGGTLLWHGFLSNITERKRNEGKIAALNKELIETSRQAGMAEVATGVLHNVGNVLNSVNISATLVSDSLRKSKAGTLPRVVELLEQNSARLGEFIASDPRGQQIPRFLQQLTSHLAAEQQRNLNELELLRKNIEHIKDIVTMQQSYAKVSGVTETVRVEELVEDALQINAAALSRHEVELVRDFNDVPTVTLHKHKVLQILVNLIRNAKYACEESGRADKRITVSIGRRNGAIAVAVADNGVGIPPENMTRIFSHGFTTRKQGHGFGLHSGALVAKEMGGVLRAHSDGVGQGATFTLELPVTAEKTDNG